MRRARVQNSELDYLIDRLGWSKGDLAERLEVHRNTVTGWTERLPVVVRLYLELLIRLRELSE